MPARRLSASARQTPSTGQAPSIGQTAQPVSPQRHRIAHGLRLLLLSATLICPTAASAASWSFHDAVRAAWTRDPARQAIHVAEKSAASEAEAARAWFPAGAIINAQYLDDHFIGSNQGYTTYQGQLSVPFWLPGQGTATERNALADMDVARANLTMERMALAMQLLDIATRAANEQYQLATLDAEQQAANDMLSQSTRALAAGEEGRADHDAVLGFFNDVSQRRAESEERIAGLRADLVRMTGVETLPDLESIDGRDLARAGRPQAELAAARDPRVLYADAVEKAAGASLEVTRRSWMPQPTAGIQVIRQKQYEALWDTSVGVQMTVQLPSEAQYTPQLMQKVRVQANAERDLLQARRIVTDEYTHTLNRLRTSVTVLNDARMQCASQSDREHQLMRAWQIGETAVPELLRARQAALTACQARDAAGIAWHSAVIRLLISSGATP